MTKSDPLKALSRRFPLETKMDLYIDDLMKRQDREVAIMGGSLLEGCFERAISKAFADTDSGLCGRIFRNRGPLSDFDSKILIAQALGIINAGMAQEAHLIRNIRNTFAHSVLEVNFKTKEVTAELKKSNLAASFFDMLSSAVVFDDKELEEVFKRRYADAPAKDRYIFLIRCGCSVLGF